MTNTLDQLIKAVCPIYGVSIGMRDDKSTWRIFFAENATPSERLAAQAVIDNFSLTGYALTENIEKVKELRRTSLDKFVKNSPGISRVYAENYYAATEFQAGRVTALMVNGAQVQSYLTALGARLGMTATQFAEYIINENRGTVGLAIKASEIEDEYLRLAYTAMPAMTGEQAEQAVIDYAAFCNARKP